ncbi:MAG TPA: alpha-amylase family glycosyl hydrolase, partial [Tepidisphaeraceae bacterium]
MNQSAALAITLCVAAWARADAGHTFTLDASAWDDKPKSVSVAGTFNGWNKEANPLKPAGNNVWTGTIKLPEGLHHYKFVIDNERYIADPKGDPDLEIDDTYGGKNSGIIAGPDARKMGPAKPNHIEATTVLFDQKSVEDLNVVNDKQVRVRVRALKDDVQSVKAIVGVLNGGTIPKRIQLPKLETTRLGYDVFGGVIDVFANMPSFGFELEDGTARGSIDMGGYRPDSSPQMAFKIEKPTFITPEWSKKAVWYQVFPERFRNGDTSNDPGDAAGERKISWTSKWWEKQPGEAGGEANFYEGKGDVWQRRYGGDLQGLREKLPYLNSLGVTAIYLNPIFEAESMHKYDTADYRHVDDNFGVKGDNPTALSMGSKSNGAATESSVKALAAETDDPSTWRWSESDKVFLAFLDEAHKQGFKIVIDGVFNHVGRAHPFFQDVLAKGKNSKYADWFDITD